MTRKMAWEKWYDINPEDEITVDSTVLLDEEEDEDNNTFDQEPMVLKGSFDFNDIISSVVINTPFGKYAMDDNLLPTNLFDCWIGHTNFDITKKELDILNKIDGVESLKVMTRYRFFIGIGKLFDFSSVRSDIQKKLLIDKNIDDDYIDNITNIISSVENNKKWAVFIGNDGSIKKIICNDDDCDNYYKSLDNLRSLKNGSIITSDSI